MPSFHDLVGSCTSLFNRHLLCLLSRFAELSCDERPCGSLHAFARNDVASIGSIPIPPITGWPSLHPHSCTHTSIGVPCGWLSLFGRDMGLPCSVPMSEWVRSNPFRREL